MLAPHRESRDVDAGSLEEFKFDIDVCREAFEYYDADKSGTLDSGEIVRLAQVLWDTFYPNSPKMDEKTTALMVHDIMSSTDINNDRLISFDEFVPWYRKMAECHWRSTHGGKLAQTQEEEADDGDVQRTVINPVLMLLVDTVVSTVAALEADNSDDTRTEQQAAHERLYLEILQEQQQQDKQVLSKLLKKSASWHISPLKSIALTCENVLRCVFLPTAAGAAGANARTATETPTARQGYWTRR